MTEQPEQVAGVPLPGGGTQTEQSGRAAHSGPSNNHAGFHRLHGRRAVPVSPLASALFRTEGRMSHAPQTAAKGKLGIWMCTALVVGNMIGSGVFLLPASLAPYGAATLLGWGITLGGALLLGLAAWPAAGALGAVDGASGAADVADSDGAGGSAFTVAASGTAAGHHADHGADR